MLIVLKNRDLADIIRDNSMCTMLLTAFARANGNLYLKKSISEPLADIYYLLNDCEVDTSKINKETPEEVQIQLDSNRMNLQLVCNNVFTKIFDRQSEMPIEMIRMCHFLEKMVAELIDLRRKSVPYLPVTSIPRPSLGLGAAFFDSIRKRAGSVKSNRQSIILALQNSGAKGLSSSPLNDSSNKKSSKSKTFNDSGDFQGELKRDTSRKLCRKPFYSSNESSRSMKLGSLVSSKGKSKEEINVLQKEDSQGNAVITQDNQALKREFEPKISMESFSRFSSSIDSISSANGQKTLEETNLGAKQGSGVLSQTQKVVGSFLFLRFFVPGKKQLI